MLVLCPLREKVVTQPDTDRPTHQHQLHPNFIINMILSIPPLPAVSLLIISLQLNNNRISCVAVDHLIYCVLSTLTQLLFDLAFQLHKNHKFTLYCSVVVESWPSALLKLSKLTILHTKRRDINLSTLQISKKEE